MMWGGGSLALHSGGLSRAEPQVSVPAREPATSTHHVAPCTLRVLAGQDLSPSPPPHLQTVKLRLGEVTGHSQGHGAEGGLKPKLLFWG